MALFTDQMHRTVEIKRSPQRIVSLVPSQTELLHHLGLEEEVIGITKFCIHPENWFRQKQRIGGTKNLQVEKIKQLQPDLIIANKEENVQEQVEELAHHFPVWISDVNTLDEACNMIKGIGDITSKTKEAKRLVTNIRTAFSQLPAQQHKPRTAYFIWKDPYMTIGGDTFINDLLERAGFTNIFQQRHRYPAVTTGELLAANCEVLLLSSEPYPFRQKHVTELQLLLPHTKILLADGEMFSWYGSRLLQAPGYFQSLQIKANL
jgi:ABC-type Fe3+-hydroxamate transport system substrate-binding protein